MYKYKILFLLLFFLSPWVYAEDRPAFELLSASKQQLPDPINISIEKDPVYNTEKKYRAYPLNFFIQKLVNASSHPLNNSILVFTASDGYKVTMSYEDALQEKGYIAFKDLSAKNGDWIKFKFGHESITPSPFYLVWPNPKLDKWRYPSPFQLITISLETFENYYSNAAPASNDPDISQGFALFSRYCIRCHSVRQTGGTLGPELASPKNITDYLTSKQLTDFILDAPSIRANSKMPVFKSILKKQDTLKIQRYLSSMKLKSITTDQP